MLLNKSFDYSYSAIDKHQPEEFFITAFRGSVRLELGMGFFSSASFNILSDGLAMFIVNGGRMNMYINKYVTKDDWDLLKSNPEHIDFDQELLNSYVNLRKTLSLRDSHFFECLALLIKEERLNIKIIVLDNGGLPHEKYGIFTDENNNKIYFNGSLNMTAHALISNLETIECTCSWHGEESKERVLKLEEHFHKIWEGKANGIKIYEANKFCNEISKDYPNVNAEKLVRDEEQFILNYKKQYKMREKNSPHFPEKYKSPFAYQEQAYKKWVERGKNGIFAMATGTGKTVTSLNCALHEFNDDGFYHILVLVPTLDLVNQWIEELKRFNFRKTIIVSSKNQHWQKDVMQVIRTLKHDETVNYAIVSTYDSFVHKDFQKMLQTLSDSIILIADEVHNVGGKKVRLCFDALTIPRRIGLSATPERIYDEVGTEDINKYFKDQPPYTFSFPMSKAIKEGRLCRYFYYPRLAYLNEQEYDKYKYYTKKLAELWDSSKNKFTNKEEAETLLMKRKRIIHKCNDKLRIYRDIIKEIGLDALRYVFVYVPEGKYLDEGENLQEERDDETFMQKLLDITKDEYPDLRCSTFSAKKSSSERNELLESFARGNINVLLAMKCLDEGVDIPRAQYGIFTSSTENPRQFIQRRGRLLRVHPDKKYSYIYDIIVLPSALAQVERTQMERTLVRSELTRAAYFASLSENHITESYDVLSSVAKHYGIIWPEILKEIEDKQ